MHEVLLKPQGHLTSDLLLQRERLVLLAILIVAFTSRLWNPWFGLPIIYTGDEGQFIPPAVKFGTGDLNPHNFLYPTLYKYLLSVSYGVYFVIGKMFGMFGSVADFKFRYFTDPSDFYAIGRMLSAVFGGLSVWIVYLIGKMVRNASVGLIAALLLTIDHLHLRFSHLAKPDVMMTFLFLVSVYYACRIYKKGQLSDYLASGAFAGLAMSTKYNAVFVVLAIPLAHFLRSSSESLSEKLKHNLGYLVLAGAAVAIFFFLGTPYALLDFKTFLKDVAFQNFAISHEQSLAGFLATSYAYLSSLFLPSAWTWGTSYLGLIALLGILWSLYDRNKLELILLVLIGVQFFYVAFKTSESFVKPHFVMPLIPLGYLFAAKAITKVWDSVKLVPARSVVVYSSALLVFAPLKSVVMFDYQRSQRDTGNIAREWVEENLPDGSRLLYAGTQGLALVESRESLLRNQSDKAGGVEEVKLEAVSKYSGPKYQIQKLHHGWSYIPREKLDKVEYVPAGLELLKAERLSLDYWRDAGIEFVIATGTKRGIEHYLERQSVPIKAFFNELMSEAILLKEFTPDPPGRPGVHIRIYKLERST